MKCFLILLLTCYCYFARKHSHCKDKKGGCRFLGSLKREAEYYAKHSCTGKEIESLIGGCTYDSAEKGIFPSFECYIDSALRCFYKEDSLLLIDNKDIHKSKKTHNEEKQLLEADFLSMEIVSCIESNLKVSYEFDNRFEGFANYTNSAKKLTKLLKSELTYDFVMKYLDKCSSPQFDEFKLKESKWYVSWTIKKFNEVVLGIYRYEALSEEDNKLDKDIRKKKESGKPYTKEQIREKEHKALKRLDLLEE